MTSLAKVFILVYATVLAAAWLPARAGPARGLRPAAVVALALGVVFAVRFSMTGSFMPTGVWMIAGGFWSGGP